MAGEKMKARLERIETFVAGNGIVRISDLAAHLGVSESTVRRDVEQLRRENRIAQNYGFIVPVGDSANLYDDPALRQNVNMQVKTALAEQAAALVEDNDVIYIESGTTLVKMAGKITAKNVTAVTSDIYIAVELSRIKGITVISTGGYIHSQSALMLGDIALHALRNLRFHKCFTSPGGIAEDGSVTYYNIQASEIRRQVFSASRQVILVAEKEKFARSAFVCDLTLPEVDVLITDGAPDYVTPERYPCMELREIGV